ncbi:hypothetical protein PHZ_c2303 [Phenylobacterium zucineum HLK1]|uniref:DUF7662 domain-containing protein n=1 Tax=Phenylobacterium zucineum (strain HLK1) TaxID=450851 RepID=B4RFE3_PHEZH|nr:hypothetical protein [Phenylobacterium zucineum]ACG78713.1 hypothetical protein PHZ_c2303 [Phenylobacterium zucineum HLK1]
MSKYKPLSQRLSGHGADEWRASFAELEEVLGFPLPKGARSGGSWWANDPDKSHSRAWTGHGWEVSEVDRAGETVTFRRNAAQADIEAAGGVQPQHAQPAVGEPLAPAPEQGPGGRVGEAAAWSAGSDGVRPEPMRRAAEAASRQSRLRKAAPLMAAGAAVVAGLATFAARRLMRRRGPEA